GREKRLDLRKGHRSDQRPEPLDFHGYQLDSVPVLDHITRPQFLTQGVTGYLAKGRVLCCVDLRSEASPDLAEPHSSSSAHTRMPILSRSSRPLRDPV